ncbi:MAG: redoxin domain-containing protein [Planctomycetes bacterium]|nr:redoxin domain-containing protein [Planctomycetota bacterium]
MKHPIQSLAFLALLALASTAMSVASGQVDPRTELDAIDARLQAAEAAQKKRYAEAESDEELQRLFRDAPWAAFVDEYAAFARAHAGSEIAVPAWASAIERAAWANRPALVPEALGVLESTHLASPSLAVAISALGTMSWTLGTNRYEVFLRRAAQESPHRGVQGFALYTLAESLGLQTTRFAPNAEPGAAGPSMTPIAADELATRKHQARSVLQRVLSDFADTPPPSARLPKDWVKRRAQGLLFELEHLQLGMVAPDFEAVDEHGEPWKLSDYEGRVVLLDFWGNW